MSISGHIIGGPADPDYHGAVLTADLAVGDTVLHVDDVADFDEDAAERDAQLALGVDLDGEGEPDVATGTAATYSGCDDDASTVTLSSPSTVAASSGDRIYIVDPVSGGPVGDVTVMVAIDDADTTGDALPVILDVALLSSVGEVDLTDLAVDLDEDEDGQLYITGFPGLTRRQGDVKFMQDTFITTALGTKVVTLTYRPLPNSEHFYWNGDYQPGSEWSRDQWDVTVPDPTDLIKVGDELTIEYAYTDPTTKPPPPPLTATFVGSSIAAGTPLAGPVALPAGTQEGDFIVASVSTYSGYSTGIPDGRMVHVETADEPAAAGSGGKYAVGWGFEDGSSAPVNITCDGGAVVVTVYRFNRTPVPNFLTGIGATAVDPPPILPDIPAGEVGIIVLCGTCGVVSQDFTDNLAPTSPWTIADHESGGILSKARTAHAYCLTDTPASSWNFASGSSSAWYYVALGIS